MPHTNKLARESSPYLLQHASNPVDWYPWGEEALSRAAAERKPIFLSIGYAACHWCHVMERESFEDPAIAALLAAHFVAVKVDREERPDLDAVYMNAVQAMTGSGGWPLSVFLTPNLKPFFGGTYFPPERRWGTASFREVLERVADAWERRRHEIDAAADTLADQLSRAGMSSPGTIDAAEAARRALASLADQHDERWGGFGGAPKFPTPSRLFFLIEAGRRDEDARAMLARTLDGMAAGGMSDWLGGGFHRYSVDEKWLVPHFEKMLYDNALLARAYGEAGFAFDRPEWLRVARETADYLLREMRGPEGGFFSSTDADSEGHEGKYFTWSVPQVCAVLPPREAELIIVLCGLEESGNFERDASVLRPALPLGQVAAQLNLTPEDAASALDAARAGMRAARARRVPPLTDDTRLAAWNGMAVWSLAWLGAALPETRYLEAARTAARFVLSQTGRDGHLGRSWRNGVTSGVETLEDIAWISAALVQLYESDGQPEWLDAAKTVLARRLSHYQDAAGALLDTPDDGPALLMRPRTPYDGATPAPVGILAGTLLRIAALTGDQALFDSATRAVSSDAGLIRQAPEACLALLQAAEAAARPPLTLVVVGDPAWRSTRQMRAAAWRHRPAACALAVSPAVPVPQTSVETVPLFAGRGPGDGERARAYLCEGGACRLPEEDPDSLAKALSQLAQGC
jgi:hypothetical protein